MLYVEKEKVMYIVLAIMVLCIVTGCTSDRSYVVIHGSDNVMEKEMADSGLDGVENDMDNDGVPDDVDSDIDGDGIHNAIELVFDNDSDGDGITNDKDTDSNGNGLSDFVEAYDIDFDGKADYETKKMDNDNDGLDDAFDPDQGGNAISFRDQDKDGTPNFIDTTPGSADVRVKEPVVQQPEILAPIEEKVEEHQVAKEESMPVNPFATSKGSFTFDRQEGNSMIYTYTIQTGGTPGAVMNKLTSTYGLNAKQARSLTTVTQQGEVYQRNAWVDAGTVVYVVLSQ